LLYHITFNFEKSRQAYEEGFVFRQRSDESYLKTAANLPKAPHPLKGTVPYKPSFDPAESSTLVVDFAVQALFCGLVSKTSDGEIVPDMARNWSIQDSGKRYIFHLRDDVRWSDGQPATAYDFEFALKRVCDPVWGPSPANLFYDIQGARAFNLGETDDPDTIGVSALDEWTLVIELETPAAYFMEILAMGPAKSVPRQAIAVYGDHWTEVENIVTNGPFKPAALQPGQGLHLERNPGYYGRFGGNLETYIAFIPDPALAKGYVNDEVDHLMIWPESSWLRQLYPDHLRASPSAQTNYYWFDVTRPPFNDPRLRRAFVFATDRKLLSDKIAYGLDSPGTGGLTPPAIPGHMPGIALPYDKDQAVKLLAEAGYPQGENFPAVDMVSGDLSVFSEVGIELQSQWRESLGVEVNHIIMPADRFRDRLLENPPHIWHLSWVADYPDPDNFLRVATWRPLSGWHHDQFEQLIKKAKQVQDQAERMALYREAELILVHEAPVVPIRYMRNQWLQKPWIRSNLGIAPLLKDVIIDPH
jgi:oligopeptide transport system substrate-binding protein